MVSTDGISHVCRFSQVYAEKDVEEPTQQLEIILVNPNARLIITTRISTEQEGPDYLINTGWLLELKYQNLILSPVQRFNRNTLYP